MHIYIYTHIHIKLYEVLTWMPIHRVFQRPLRPPNVSRPSASLLEGHDKITCRCPKRGNGARDFNGAMLTGKAMGKNILKCTHHGCIYIHICTYVYLNMCSYVYIYIEIYVFVFMRLCLNIFELARDQSE